MASRVCASLFLAAAMAIVLMAPVRAMDHIVGGSFGWATPENVTFYQDWAKPRTFGVGDRLVFPFRAGAHNIIEVNKEDFDNCTQNKVVGMEYKGPVIMELPDLGDHYYYCGTGLHCEAGQKFGITVVNETGSAGVDFNLDTAASLPAADEQKSEQNSSANSIRNFGVIASVLSFSASFFF
ncbi:hypothetical protein GIB67_006367 [Kingdonia uniflora]|uniref:Phytocyanin domain-containing protein n=1 Tax=Kingdonia uniflora TaxID=39325 RepID=A0A7J7P0P0_9MAGN|nr:hypothetical protein GIB67_006367 [Kingdonia uniflora]